MKAIRYHQFGDIDVLRQEEVDIPSPGPGEVLVKVAATSFNPVDDHIRMGILAEAIPTPLPITPGLDVSGTVSVVGENVRDLQVGDRVVAMLPLDAHGGAAEFALVSADLVAAAPSSLALEDAAALPLSGLAAHQAAVELARIKASDTVLVNGAGGAVGSIVVQLATDAGATVTAVDHLDHAERLRAYGAAAVHGPLDLAAGPQAVGGPFDVVINHVRLAPEDLARLTAFVADGGIVVSSAGPVPDDEQRGVRTAGVWVRPDAANLADLVSLIDDGRLVLHVVDRRPVDELSKVHEASSTGSLAGKTILVVG
jgi:NADPH:quinone reductase-like Zn-dependent oxidoreductase